MFFNKKKVLHYGLQRSGTNYLRSLLQKFFRVKFLNSNKNRANPVQKHFRLYDEKDIIPEPKYKNNILVLNFKDFEQKLKKSADIYIVVSKNPYSWLISYENWAKKCDWPEVDHHYIQEWNLFYEKWLELASQTEKIIFVKYIELIKDLNNELEKIAYKANLKRKIIYPFIDKHIQKVSQSDEFTKKRKKYYLNEEYIDKYSDKKFKRVNELIDKNVVKALGYKVEKR
jgi:hypothetical protein